MPIHTPNRRHLLSLLGLTGVSGPLGASLTACVDTAPPRVAMTPASTPFVPDAADLDRIEDVERRTFTYFQETTDAQTGLAPDNWPNPDFASIAATGFALSAMVVGAARGYLARDQAASRCLVTLRTFWNGPQGPDREGVIGHKGFFYHFLNMDSALRFKNCELSSIDTCLFLCGALIAGGYFDGPSAEEVEIRKLAIALYERVDWTFMTRPDGLISMGWHPEPGLEGHDASGLIRRNWTRYNEGMMVYLLAMASPTHPAGNWQGWIKTLNSWGTNFGREHLGFAPMFGHQYSHAWFDFRDVADAYMRAHNSDYFRNSREATMAQRNYAIRNPYGFAGYDADMWGLTASRGPADIEARFNGRKVAFHEYAARGPITGDGEGVDDGTLAPTAGIGSMPFAPELSVPLVRTLMARYGSDIYGPYGFIDAFNPSFPADITTKTGHATVGAGWVAREYLGIDQGPILIGIENYRSGLIWDIFNRSALTGPIVRRGFTAAGFVPVGPRGQWLTKGS